MREIKFRAWGHFGDSYKDCMIQNWQNSDYVEYVGFDGGGFFELMQFTGLKDKNGKEIYVGDIIRLNNISYDPENDLYYEGIVLIEATDDLGYKITPISPPLDERHDSTSMWHFAEGTTTMVIGNVYENPNLAEVEHE